MQKLPVKSTERKVVHNNLVSTYARKDDLASNATSLASSSTKAKTILKIILIIVSVAAGTAVCSSVIYFVFLKKEEVVEGSDSSSGNEDQHSSTATREKSLKLMGNVIKSYKCTDIITNCRECKEVYENDENNETRVLAAKEKEVEEESPNPLSSIECTSCNEGYYPIYVEDIILFCNKLCDIGEGKMCKTCHTENQNQCGTCNPGYYLPNDDMKKFECKKCSDLIENCEDCHGSKNSIVCTACKNSYFLSTEKNRCEPLCSVGSNNLCKTCNTETNKCATCNSGYYLPSDDENQSECKRCSDINDKCQECHGTKTSVKCLSCKSGYIPFYNNNNEIEECNLPCETGSGNLCKTCDSVNNQCSSCNEGYYLPTDDLYKLQCKKCTDIVKNCKECHGELNSVTCDDFGEGDKQKCGPTCRTGPNELCLTCDDVLNQCATCNIGYYLPTDSTYKLTCNRCDYLIGHCRDCYGSLSSITCTQCYDNYILSNNVCTLPQQQMCEIGPGEKCLTCNQDKCATCNEGYYLPSDDEQKIKCKKCSVEGCRSCYGTKNSDTCTECYSHLRPIFENSIIKQCTNYKCTTGPNEKCLTCDRDKDICGSCNPGYYLPTDSPTKLECQKCSIENCAVCSGTMSWNVCSPCKDGFAPILQDGVITQCKKTCKIGPEELCKTCHETEPICASCNMGYVLEYGVCKLHYTYRATYLNEYPYEKVTIQYTFSQYIKAMIVDGEEIVQTRYNTYYNFPEVRVHEVYVLLEIPERIEGYDNLFYYCEKMQTIKFTPLFNTSGATSMNLMFGGCSNLFSIDVSVFDVRKVVRMDSMFALCEKLTSIDITNFNPKNLVDISNMFSKCYKLTSIDLSKFNAPKLSSAGAAFAHCHSLTSMDLSYIRSFAWHIMDSLFLDCKNLQYVNLANIYTDTLTKTGSMFKNCGALTSLDFSSFNTKKLKYMSSMFEGCTSLTSIDLWHFVTPDVSEIMSLFKGCTNLKYINMASATYKYGSNIYEGVPDGGTIIVNPLVIANAEKYLKAKNWNIIEATEYKK